MPVAKTPRWPVLDATVASDGAIELNLASKVEHLQAGSVDEAREVVRDRVAAYAREHLNRPVRVEVRDPTGTWLLAIHPSGVVEQLDDAAGPPAAPSAAPIAAMSGDDEHDDENDEAAGESGENDGGDNGKGGGERPAPAPIPREGPHRPLPPREPRLAAAREGSPRQPSSLVSGLRAAVATRGSAEAGTETPAESWDRRAMYERTPGRMGRFAGYVAQRLKSPEEVAEDDVDEQLQRRHVVTEPNLVCVASPKGGPGKTTITIAVGDALARYLPNQRVLAVDFNPGGGALGATTPEDRAGRWTMLDLYERRREIRTAAQLQPFVGSLASGLDVLAVPPDPTLALSITPGHYDELLEHCLLPNYDVVLLDTKPDVIAPVTLLALDRAHQLVIVSEQGFLSGKVVEHSLDFLLGSNAAGPDATRTTVTINKVLADPRAGRVDEARRQLARRYAGAVVEIPFDLDMQAQINAGDYSVAAVRRRATRLPLKQLALHVAEHLV